MKKLMMLMIGLGLVLGTTAISFGQDQPAQQQGKKKHGKKKKAPKKEESKG